MNKITTLVILVMAAPVAVCASPSSVAMDPVALNVHFKLADLDYKPIPNSTVRVTFGSDARWHFATIDHGCGGILVRNCQKTRLPQRAGSQPAV